MSYTVNLWGSSPDAGNDDCHTGDDFDSLEKAMEVYREPFKYFNYAGEQYYLFCTHTIELDGPGVHLERVNPAFKPSRDNWEDERREAAMMAGMAFGCQGYNEVMGWD